MVDYLSSTGIYEFAFEGSLPKEAPPFKSLWLPFDHYTWAFSVGTIVVAIFMLILIDSISSTLREDGLKLLTDHAPEGQFKILGPKLLLLMGCEKLGGKNCLLLPSVGEQKAN